MSWDLGDVLTGLHTAYTGVTGMGPVLEYEPRSFQAFPCMYTLCDSVTWLQQGMGGSGRKPIYKLTSTLVFLWQDTPEAEADMNDFVDSVPAAVHADMSLGGELDGGANCIVEACERIYVETETLKFPALQFSLRAGTMEDIAT